MHRAYRRANNNTWLNRPASAWADDGGFDSLIYCDYNTALDKARGYSSDGIAYIGPFYSRDSGGKPGFRSLSCIVGEQRQFGTLWEATWLVKPTYTAYRHNAICVEL